MYGVFFFSDEAALVSTHRRYKICTSKYHYCISLYKQLHLLEFCIAIAESAAESWVDRGIFLKNKNLNLFPFVLQMSNMAFPI